MNLSPEMCQQGRTLIASRLGLEFPETRLPDLERGLIHACQGSSFSTPAAYFAWLATLPDGDLEWNRLAGYLTVGETYFFRDRACFEALENRLLPTLITARRLEGTLRLRIWSAGCATGEEPYSLAILLDRLLPDRAEWVLTILATDVNLEALGAARRGRYRAWALRETPRPIQDRYFRPADAENLILDRKIRDMVTFAPLNLAAEGYPAAITNTHAMDLIICRNVLMYLTQEIQRAIVSRLCEALVPGGWLVVGAAEGSGDLCQPLVPVNFSGAIFYRKDEKPAVSPEQVALSPVPEAQETSSPFETPDQSLTPKSEALSGTLAVPSQPATPDTRPLLERARLLADQGNLEQARGLCLAALAQDRLDPEAHLLLGAICQEQGRIPEAMDALRRALYLTPDSAPTHFLLGSLLLRQGKREEGRRRMETVVHLLNAVPRDEALPGGDGLTAGRLLETARMYVELLADRQSEGALRVPELHSLSRDGRLQRP